MNKKSILTTIFACVTLGLMAQTEPDPNGASTNYDTTNFSNDSAYTTSIPQGAQNQELTAPTYKQYVRFTPPMDTITNLITYLGVVPFAPNITDIYDGGTIDSLYLRAKLYLMTKYIKDFKAQKGKPLIVPKELLVEDMKPDGENGRIIVRPTVPLYIRNNSFSNTPAGTVTFNFEIRVKEDKYKYKFSKFVHNTVEKGSEKQIKTYIEYYANNNRGFKGTDQILLAVDRMVKDLVKELGKVMKDPIVLDQDEF
jgi:hypothetical protein